MSIKAGFPNCFMFLALSGLLGEVYIGTRCVFQNVLSFWDCILIFSSCYLTVFRSIFDVTSRDGAKSSYGFMCRGVHIVHDNYCSIGAASDSLLERYFALLF